MLYDALMVYRHCMFFQIQRKYNIKSEPEYNLGDNDVSMLISC